MNKTILKKMAGLAIVLLFGALLAGPSLAVDLVAIEGQWTPPGTGTTPVTMWGFATDIGQACDSSPAWGVGPPIPALAEDNITINLRNCLSEPVSILIPGQVANLNPVSAGGRVTSFTNVTPPGGTGIYTWNGVKPGAYLYHSGANMAKQVHMGLYGALVVNASAGTAYNGTNPVTYDNEVVLFFSEIDPALHNPPAFAHPNDYMPRYFLINGQPYVDGAAPVAIGAVNQTTLVRMLSTCLDDIVPTMLGMHWDLIAEDGNRYPYPRKQYTSLLSAMKTIDAIIVPGTEGTYPVFDRRLNLSNDGDAPGGMVAKLQVGGSALTAANDSATTAEDTAVTIDVLNNDSVATAVESVTQPANGIVVNNGANFTYTPNTDFVGSDAFTYRATDGTNFSNVATVTVTVENVNDAPVANPDSYSVAAGGTLTVAAPGVLGNDTDLDGDSLTAVPDTNVSLGTLALDSDGSFTYTPSAGTTSDSFTYFANDGTANSDAAATVTITVTPPPDNQPPVANDDFATTQRNVGVTISILTNDTDPDGSLVPSSVLVPTTSSRGGTITLLNTGSVIFTPRNNFRGTDTFEYSVADNDGARSENATVTVNVVR